MRALLRAAVVGLLAVGAKECPCKVMDYETLETCGPCTSCPPGRFGQPCIYPCPPCVHGSCLVDSPCACHPGYIGNACDIEAPVITMISRMDGGDAVYTPNRTTIPWSRTVELRFDTLRDLGAAMRFLLPDLTFGFAYSLSNVQLRTQDVSLRFQEGPPGLHCSEVQLFWDAPTGYTLCLEIPTPTSTASESDTRSQTVTPSRSASRTPSNTLTETPTPSTTDTATRTPSTTDTGTITPSATDTATHTPSMTHTETPTPSITDTATRTPSTTDTFTLTPSPTASPTSTFTGTGTSTSSFTATPSITTPPTLSITRSLTTSPSLTSTSTVTPSSTSSLSESMTPPVTPSLTESQSSSVTRTHTDTASPTCTHTLTMSISLSLTATASSSLTASHSLSATPLSSPTPSPTLSDTTTLTPTPSLSSSHTPSSTTTPSQTHSLTQTPTPSLSQSRSRSRTSTSSVSFSVTATLSPTVTQSTTPSDTPTGTRDCPALFHSLPLCACGPWHADRCSCDEGRCESCHSGWFGATCSTQCPDCHHGRCDDGVDGTGGCLCDLHWHGEQCSTPSCSSGGDLPCVCTEDNDGAPCRREDFVGQHVCQGGQCTSQRRCIDGVLLEGCYCPLGEAKGWCNDSNPKTVNDRCGEGGQCSGTPQCSHLLVEGCSCQGVATFHPCGEGKLCSRTGECALAETLRTLDINLLTVKEDDLVTRVDVEVTVAQQAESPVMNVGLEVTFEGREGVDYRLRHHVPRCNHTLPPDSMRTTVRCNTAIPKGAQEVMQFFVSPMVEGKVELPILATMIPPESQPPGALLQASGRADLQASDLVVTLLPLNPDALFPLHYRYTVKNRGPASATNLRLLLTIDGGVLEGYPEVPHELGVGESTAGSLSILLHSNASIIFLLLRLRAVSSVADLDPSTIEAWYIAGPTRVHRFEAASAAGRRRPFLPSVLPEPAGGRRSILRATTYTALLSGCAIAMMALGPNIGVPREQLWRFFISRDWNPGP